LQEGNNAAEDNDTRWEAVYFSSFFLPLQMSSAGLGGEWFSCRLYCAVWMHADALQAAVSVRAHKETGRCASDLHLRVTKKKDTTSLENLP
jgi:hypothetical protein